MQLSSCIGENLLAEISIASLHHKHPVPLGYISDLTVDSSYMETKLSRCLTETTRGAGGNLGPAVDYDAFQWEHMMSLKMCLLDATHALYIKALAILPTSAGSPASFVPSLCLDIATAPWTLCPTSSSTPSGMTSPSPCEMPTQDHIEAQGGILDTSPMSRVESCSLDGLVAILCSTSRAPLSVHEVLEYLYFWNCDLSRLRREILGIWIISHVPVP
jgi:hypothetical protein